MAARTKVFVDIVTQSEGGKKPGAGLAKFAIAAGIAAVAIGALIKIGKDLVNVYSVQEQAEARLEQTIKSTGQAAGLTSDQLLDMASGLQEVTKFGDEAIIGAESLLLTFKDIGGDIFPRALESILDVSEAMGTGLKESTIQVGKALNDPIQGLTALRRVGIQFSDTQEDLIKGFVAVNDLASAQDIILEELESQFGGIARAVGQTSTAAFTQLANVQGDLKEAFGRMVADGLAPVARVFTELIATAAEYLNIQRDLKDSIDRFNEGTGDTADKVIALAQNLNTAKVQLESLNSQYNISTTSSEAFKRVVEEKIIAIEADIEATNQLRIAEERGAAQNRQGAAMQKQIAADRASSDAAFLEVLDRIEERRQDALTEDEKAREAIQAEINANIILRDALIETGKVYEGVQELIDDQAKERDALTEQIKEDAIVQVETAQEVFDARVELADAWREGQEARINELRDIEVEANDDSIDALKDKEAAYKEMANTLMGFIDGPLEAMGAALADGDAGWGGFAKAGIEAIAAVVRALAKMAIVEAAIRFAKLDIPGGIAFAAAGAAGFVAAGAISASAENFATGGSFTTNEPTLIRVGEQGQENVTVTPTSGNNNSGGIGGQDRIWIQVEESGGFWGLIQRGVDNRKFVSNTGDQL